MIIFPAALNLRNGDEFRNIADVLATIKCGDENLL
jgi:hypothetical protein